MKYILGVLVIMATLFGCNTTETTQDSEVDERRVWELATGADIWSSPVLENGKLYFGNDNGSFYSVNSSNGTVSWQFETQDIIRSKPALSSDSVYFVSDDGNLYSLNKETGDSNWILEIGSEKRLALPKNGAPYDYDFRQASPVLEGDYLYVGSSNSNLYKVNPADGTIVWEFKADKMIRTTPYVKDDSVYVGSWKGTIYCVNKETGSEKWSYKTKGIVNSDFASIDNSILIGSRDTHLYAIDMESGEVNWSYRFTDRSWIESSCVVVNNNIILGSSDSMKLLSLSSTGEVNWTFNTGGWSWGTPAVVEDTVYIGSIKAPSYTYFPHSDMKLYAVDLNSGEEKWSYEPGRRGSGFIAGGVYTTPVIDNGIVYFGSIDGKLYAIQS